MLKMRVKNLLILVVLMTLAAGPVFALCTDSGDDTCCCKPKRGSKPSISTQQTPCCDVSKPTPVADPVRTDRTALTLDSLVLILSLDTPAESRFEPVFLNSDRSGPGDTQTVSLYTLHAALLI